MPTAWTGGAYSVLRGAFAVSVTASAALAAGPLWIRATAAVAAIALAVGIAAPIAACVALASTIAIAGVDAYRAHPSAAIVAVALAVHALVPRAPYGSVAALGRLDPRGGWHFASWLRAAAWIATFGVAVASALARDEIRGAPPALRVVLCVAALLPRVRPFAWLALVGVEAVAASEHAHELAARVLALGILFDPAWVPGAPGGVERVYYDGSCGLCHRAARFVLSEDPDGSRFRLGPIGCASFEAAIPADRRASLPDSMVAVTHDGRVLVRSDGALHILLRLGGVWRVLGSVARAVPRPLRDAVYDGIARIRKRLFAGPKESCPLVPADLRGRFEA